MTAKQEQIMCDQESELEDLRSRQCLLCNGSLGHHKEGCKGAIPWQELYNRHNAVCVKLEKAESACAEMRNCLDDCRAMVKNEISAREIIGKSSSAWTDLLTGCVSGGGIEHALSSDCGQGWLSPEKAKVAMEALHKIAIGPGCYCDCHEPIELCECAERIAKEAILKLSR